jgi:hypothetical protein
VVEPGELVERTMEAVVEVAPEVAVMAETAEQGMGGVPQVEPLGPLMVALVVLVVLTGIRPEVRVRPLLVVAAEEELLVIIIPLVMVRMAKSF